VWATAPPYSVHVMAARLAAKLSLPLVLDYRDPYCLNTIYPPGPLDRPIKVWLERSTARKASRLTAVSEGYARRQEEFLGMKVAAILNGWDRSDGIPDESVEPPSAGDPLVLVHTGTVYPTIHDLPLLIEGIQLAVERGVDLRIESCGSGGKHFIDALTPLGLEGVVRDHGTVSRGEATRMRAGGSVQVLFLPSNPEDEGTIPSKVFDYLVTGRPVLAVGSADSEPGRIMEAGGGGASVGSAEEVAQRLELLFAAQSSGDLAAHAIPPERAEAFSGRAMAASFSELLEQVVKES